MQMSARSTVKLVMAVTGLLKPAQYLRRKMRKISNLPAKHGWTNWTPLVPERELIDCCENAIARLRERSHEFGDYLEFGVSRGTSIACMHRVLVTQRMDQVRLFGFDSFEGIPADEEGWPEGEFASSLKATQRYLSECGVGFGRTTLVKGWYKDTLNEETKQRLGLKKASLVMIDCDIYSASRAALFFCEPLIVDHAVILFDDWGWREEVGEVGQKEAFDELLGAFPELTAEPLPGYFKHARVFLVERRTRRTAKASC
jgi:O-methyltransferase